MISFQGQYSKVFGGDWYASNITHHRTAWVWNITMTFIVLVLSFVPYSVKWVYKFLFLDCTQHITMMHFRGMSTHKFLWQKHRRCLKIIVWGCRCKGVDYISEYQMTGHTSICLKVLNQLLCIDKSSSQRVTLIWAKDRSNIFLILINCNCIIA